MQLSELVVSNKLIIEIRVKTEKLEYPTTVVLQKDNYILTEPIRINGKVLSFENTHSHIDLMFSRPDKSPVIWKNVITQIVVFNGASCYKFVATGVGTENNRRASFRLFLGLDGVAQMGLNRSATDVIVKDVSESGFSFVTDKDIDNYINTSVRLVFSDEGKQYILIGLMVRKVNNDPKRIVYGCKLTAKNQVLIQYIAMKQREILRSKTRMSSGETAKKLDKAINEKGSGTDKSNMHDTIKNDGIRKKINDVEKDERRNIFKEKF